MSKDGELSIAEMSDAAFKLAARQVIETAERSGTPIIIWEDGAIREMAADVMKKRLETILAADKK